MQVLLSQIDKTSSTFQSHFARMSALCQRLQAYLQEASQQGSAAYCDRHIARGKLLANERLALLLDRGSPFLELMPLAGLGQEGISLGGSLLAGIGQVQGHTCLIHANIPTLKGGALNHISVEKSLRLDEIAWENKLPVIYLNESAGADLLQQALIFTKGGAAFRSISQRSKAGLPSIAVVFGSSTAGGAYVPGMSDYVVMVKRQARAYLAGPPLVKMAIAEDCEEEPLGGAEMHAKQSGLCDYLADDEKQGIAIARSLLRHYPRLSQRSLNFYPKAACDEPLYEAEELLGIVSPHLHKNPFDVREVIARLVDGSRFSEFKPLYGATLVCGWAEIFGVPVGILANNGVLLSEAANKGAHFIQLCGKRGTPLIFLQNITGFMVGTKAEQEGIIKNGAKLINAVSNHPLPALTFIIGASYGAGNYGMCGRAYRPRFLFSWPNAKIAVMGPQQLVGVLSILQAQKSLGQEQGPLEAQADREKQLKAAQAALAARVECESEVYYGSSRLWDDGVIDPRDTRKVIGFCLAVIASGDSSPSTDQYGVFRM